MMVKTNKAQIPYENVSREDLVTSNDKLSEWQKTGITNKFWDCPPITLIESKMGNVWYHPKMEQLFKLNWNGFEPIFHLDKNFLKAENLLR